MTRPRLIRLSLVDFKIIEEGHLSLGRITVLIGPNGAGKSSFIQTLNLLKQSAGQAALNCNGRLVTLGGFEDICRVGSKEITIELTLDVPVDEIYGQESLTFIYSQTFTNSTVSRAFVELQLSPQAYLIRLEMDESGAEQASSTVQIPLSDARFDRGVLTLPRVSIIDPEVRDAWTKATLAFTNFFRSFQAMHSIPGFTHPEYPLSDRVDDIRDDPGKSASTIAYHRRLEQPMSEMLSRILGSEVVVRADLKSGRNVSIEVEDRVHRGNVVNEGFGVNRLLEGPLLELLLADEGALVAIEEPEAHLSLPRFSGHLHCGEMLAQRGVQDGHTIPGRVPPAGGGVSAAA